MLKFFTWFMKLLHPDPEKFVRNIQTGHENGNQTDGGVKPGKKSVSDKDLVFWMPTKKIIEVKKNNQGLITDIHLASGAGFTKVNYIGKFVHTSKKQGLSRVYNHISVNLSTEDELVVKSKELMEQDARLTFLHIGRYGDGFIYGESKGLSIREFDGKLMVLDGTEDNVFYELSQECLEKLVPKKEQ